MQRFLKLSIAIALASSVAATNALAHAFLDRAIPAVGGSVAGSPREIRLYFTQGVVTAFSGVRVTSESGAPVPTGRLVNDPSDQSTRDRPSRTCSAAGHLYGQLACGLGGHASDPRRVQLYGVLSQGGRPSCASRNRRPGLPRNLGAASPAGTVDSYENVSHRPPRRERS